MEIDLIQMDNDLYTQEGDLVELVGTGYKNFIFTLKSGEIFHTHRGILQHDDLIGIPWGSSVFSHNDKPFFLLQPSLENALKNLPRCTQILYPKDIGYIITKMGVGPGTKVVEAGTGSGSLTIAFSYFIGESGELTSYDINPHAQAVAKKNIRRFKLKDNVVMKEKDIIDGFDEIGVDVLFLDLPNPHDYIHQVKRTLKTGGHFGCILPTSNQVCRLLACLKSNHFAFVEVVEVLLRFYKPDPDRFRPADRMVAHTGFLVFSRPVIIATEPTLD